jgi:glycosyltransferase involved in cell wall biosynthesis
MAPGKQIRLLVDAHCFDGEYQGSRTFITGIYTELVKRKDIHVFLAAFNTANLKKYFPEADNLTIIRYSSRSALLRLSIDIPLLVRKHRIDYLHVQYFLPLVRNCRQIVTIHDVLFREDPRSFPWLYRVMKTFLYRRSAKRADLVTTVSEHSKNSIIQYLKCGQDKISVIPNGVASEFFGAGSKTGSKLYIQYKYGFDRFLLCVSRFEPRKNQLLLVKTFLDLALYNKGYHLVLIGHQSLPIPGLQKLLDNLKPSVRQFILISDDVPHEELLQFYRAAEVFVYPSQAEGFGIPPLEAGAVGTPVICSNLSGLAAFSFFGEGHINPLVPGQLETSINTGIDKGGDEELLQTISDGIKEKYSWERSSEKFYQLLLNHSMQTDDQFSTAGTGQGKMADELSAGQAFFLSGD